MSILVKLLKDYTCSLIAATVCFLSSCAVVMVATCTVQVLKGFGQHVDVLELDAALTLWCKNN